MFLFNLYKYITKFFGPILLPLIHKKRVNVGKEDIARKSERFGISTFKKPNGKIIWFHAASVGEGLSTLILMDALIKENPDVYILITTGTVGSANVLAKKLPERSIHQFIPYDIPQYIERFLNYWNPEIALFFESELWPNSTNEIIAKNIPLILINAKLSDRSYKKWMMVKNFSNYILSKFDLILCQSQLDKDRYEELGGRDVEVMGNLKFVSSESKIDLNKLENMKKMIGVRKTWLAVSTHKDDEEVIILAHQNLRKSLPDLLTVIIPRHPDRNIEFPGSIISRRSKNEQITDQTEIYIADTFGEANLFYQLSDIVLVGGSFAQNVGGHNLIEPARFDKAVLHGPLMYSQAAMTKLFKDDEATIEINDSNELTEVLSKLFKSSEMIKEYSVKAKKVADSQQQILPFVISRLQKYFRLD